MRERDLKMKVMLGNKREEREEKCSMYEKTRVALDVIPQRVRLLLILLA